MANRDLSGKLEQKMEQLRRRLEELPGEEDIQQQLKGVADELERSMRNYRRFPCLKIMRFPVCTPV